MIRVHCCVKCDDLEKLMSINTAVTSGDRTFQSVDLLRLLQNVAGRNSHYFLELRPAKFCNSRRRSTDQNVLSPEVTAVFMLINFSKS